MSKKVRITEEQFHRALFEESIVVSYDNPLSIEMSSESINEGLIKTYPFETMMRYVREYFNIPEFYMHTYSNNGVQCAAFDLPKNKTFQKRVDKAMNLCGYFESTRSSMDELDRIHYEPKFKEEEKEIGDFLYHITPHYTVGKIKKIGLCPYHKNAKFNYPSRIYFFKEDVPREILKNAAKALDKYSKRKIKDGIYRVLKIDVNSLPDNIKFFVDPNARYALYTLNNIPPNCIVDGFDTIDVKET